MLGCQASEDAGRLWQEKAHEEPNKGRPSKDGVETMDAGSIKKVV